MSVQMPQQLWLTKIGKYTVEKVEIPRRSGLPYGHINVNHRGCLHTTEGSLMGSLASLRQDHFASKFMTGEGRILQLRPLMVEDAALHDPMNRLFDVQIEMAAFTGGNPKTPTAAWMLADPTLGPTIALMAYFAKPTTIPFIPLTVPFNWPDDLSDCPLPWAANNARRQKAAHEGTDGQEGWWEHLEVPMQAPSWHFDCGKLYRSRLLPLAQTLIDSGDV